MAYVSQTHYVQRLDDIEVQLALGTPDELWIRLDPLVAVNLTLDEASTLYFALGVALAAAGEQVGA